MAKYRRALCLECGFHFLIERGSENGASCTECGAQHYVYRVVVDWRGGAGDKDWLQMQLKHFISGGDKEVQDV